MQSPQAFLRGVRHPEAFHGEGRERDFFEGWYIKLVSADLAQRWAVIPGLFRAPRGGSRDDDVAFVQVLDGQTGQSSFNRFALEEFAAATDRFSVTVGGNTFDSHGVTLDLPELRGRLEYATPIDPWPVTLASPGIMGWYGLVPFMECFHGVVSFGHQLRGALEVHGTAVSFDNGRGYIEKDWGRAFPEGYVWMHTNHFANNPDACLVASVAIIPWLGGAFRGFIIGLRNGPTLSKWTTYNRTREKSITVDDTHVSWDLHGPAGTLEIRAERAAGGLLHAPLRTAMYERVEETMRATIHVRHIDPRGAIVFDDAGECGSMEIFGDLDKLLGM